MVLKNNRCYADDFAEVLCITSAENLGNYRLKVTFNGREARIFDGTQLFSGEVFQPLREESVFDDFKLDYETLTWLNGEVDVAPEFVYDNSTKIS